MKGLLHRLAARAAGTTVPVRSDARLSFGGANLGWGENIEIEAPSEPLAMAAASHLARERGAGRHSTQPDGSEDDVPAPMRRSTPSAQPMTRTDLLPPAPPDVRADVLSASPATSPAAPLASADPRLPPRFVGGRSLDATRASPVHPEPCDVPARRPTATQVPLTSLRPDSAMRLNEESTLLMPSAAAELVLTRTGVPAAARGPNAAAPAADKRAEVHIHIGRIEVTAVQEAASPRTRPSRKQAPMSLDAYLAARSKT